MRLQARQRLRKREAQRNTAQHALQQMRCSGLEGTIKPQATRPRDQQSQQGSPGYGSYQFPKPAGSSVTLIAADTESKQTRGPSAIGEWHKKGQGKGKKRRLKLVRSKAGTVFVLVHCTKHQASGQLGSSPVASKVCESHGLCCPGCSCPKDRG